MITKIKIQSISDVITNSSTEIYTVYDEKDIIQTIKDMVNSILTLGQSDLCFDDLFIIEMHWNEEDLWEDHGFSNKEEWIKTLEENHGYYLDWGYSNWYEVKAKPEAKKLLGSVQKIADLINHIDSTFESFDYRC